MSKLTLAAKAAWDSFQKFSCDLITNPTNSEEAKLEFCGNYGLLESAIFTTELDAKIEIEDLQKQLATLQRAHNKLLCDYAALKDDLNFERGETSLKDLFTCANPIY